MTNQGSRDMEIEMDEKITSEIKKEALNMVKSLFETPEQLDKLDIFISKETKKEKKCQENLQNLIKSHVEGVKSTIQDLRISVVEASCLQNGVKEIHSLIDDYRKLEKKLEKLTACSQTASSTTQTLNLLSQIINMSANLEVSKKLLDDMQLLQVHKNLREMENVRDKIFSKHFDVQIHNDSAKSAEKNLLLKNFEPILGLSDGLFKKIKSVLENTATYCIDNPTTLVTAIRIIEREERVDEYWSDLQRNNTNLSCYIPPGRPKKWASYVDVCISNVVTKKIDNLRKSINFEDKLALAEFLEHIRAFYVKDLLHIQTHAQRCFPPSYKILTRYCDIYHKKMCDIVNELIISWGDQPNETDVVTLLLFDRDYLTEQLFGSKKFDSSLIRLIRNSEPLLNAQTIQKLEHFYLTDVCDNLTQKVCRIISIDKRAMEGETPPNITQKKYCTFLNTFYDDFVGVKIKNATKLSSTTFNGVFTYCIMAFEQLVVQYDATFENYVKMQFRVNKGGGPSSTISNIFRHERHSSEGRDEAPTFPYFIEYCIAVSNNCEIIKNALSQLCNDVSKEVMKRPENRSKHDSLIELLGEEHYNRVLQLNTQIDEFSSKCNNTIANDYLLDVKTSFEEFLTQRWKDNAAGWSEGFHNSLIGFSEMLSFLQPIHNQNVLLLLDKGLAFRYINRFLNAKMKYSIDDIRIYGDLIYKDAIFLCDFFSRSLNTKQEMTTSYAILLCTSVFKNLDPDCSLIDVAKIFKTYSDFTREHGIALLSKRPDLSKEKIQETVFGLTENVKPNPDSKCGLFMHIKIS